MAKEIRRINYDEFAARLPILLEALARENETVLVEKEGKLYRVEPTSEADALQARPHDPDRVRRMLVRTAGSFKGVDRAALMKDIHAGRQQASKGRPA